MKLKKKTKHTPGPWGFEDKTNRHMVTAGMHNGAFRYICDPSYSPVKSQKANSILIAHAPELLKALKLAACCIDSEGYKRILQLCLDVIARAEGRGKWNGQAIQKFHENGGHSTPSYKDCAICQQNGNV